MKQTKSITSLLLLIIWMLIVLLGYYYYHKPFSIDSISSISSALLDFLLATVIVILAGGIGAKITQVSFLTSFEQASVQASIGLGILGFSWLLLGLLNLFYSWLAWLLLIFGLVFTRKYILTWLRHFTAISELFRKIRKLERIFTIFAIVMVAYQLVIALAPPLKYDALTYHLQLPRIYLNAGSMINLPENPYWGHPQLAEMLYTFAMALHRGQTAAVVGWYAGILFLLGMIGLTERLFGSMGPEPGKYYAGVGALISIIVGQTFRYELGGAYTDQFSALYGLATVILFLAWLENSEKHWLLLSYLVAGMAISIKLTNGVLFLGILLASIVHAKQGRLKIVNFLLGGLLALLPVMPWLVKNFAVTGNPIFPYVFPTEYFSAERLSNANLVVEPIQMVIRLTLPFSMTWMGVENGGVFMSDIGPLLLFLSLPGMIVLRKDNRAQAIALIVIPGLIALGIGSIWLAHLIQPRLYFSVLLLIGIYAGAGWHWIQGQVLNGARLRRIFGVVILLILGFALVIDIQDFSRKAPLGTILGIRSEEAYRLNNLGYYELAMEKINAFPAQTKVMMLWEAKGFYAPLSSQPDLWIDRFLTDWRDLESPEAVITKWKARGFTHVLLFKAGKEFVQSNPSLYTPDDWEGLDMTLDLMNPIETFDDIYTIYSIP